MSFIKVPKLTLSNGREIPVVGLGTWKTKPNEIPSTIKKALKIGYRHFDCAPVYNNLKELGKSLDQAIDKNVVTRRDLFITCKLWNTFHRPDSVEIAIKQSLSDLRTSYIDLYLMHWPMAYKEGEKFIPLDSRGNVEFSSVHFVDTWKAMEVLVQRNLAKSIGVCNFNKRQIEKIIQSAKIPPVINQVECHPFLNQENLWHFCNSHNITITCNNPLALPERFVPDLEQANLLDTPLLYKIGRRYRKTAAQVVLKYQLQRRNVVIPRTTHGDQLHENLNLFDFEMDEDEMAAMGTLNKNLRYIQSIRKNDSKHPEYPFKDPF
ncbi:hypothetical protein PPYR_13423 [Photinus pyralis]|uniref:NADP-dependent oxidoreductase domain-containing protein n=1 Tax=Photinus pyralis TaxID=7054 RepID=A0A5N4A904_PHOPY|nr:aldo-keto reductase family 1 member A1-like [Photinus pyralis]KAB0793803.1 hypothetical protein PPYR_13423 [Photinus pyralis]